MSIETRVRATSQKTFGGASSGSGSGIVYAPTGGPYISYITDPALTAEKVLTASNNILITTDASAVYLSAITGAGSVTSTAGLVQSSFTITTVYPLSGGGNLSANRSFYADTAFLVNTGRQIISGLGLAGGGDLSSDRTLSVNTNVRDKVFGYFFAGSLSTLMSATSAMIYMPYNMELRSVQIAVSHSAGGQNIVIQPTLWNGSLTASSALFAAANRPTVVTNNLVGSNGALGSNILHGGSWLGIQIDSVGTTVIASNMTVNIIVRTS